MTLRERRLETAGPSPAAAADEPAPEVAVLTLDSGGLVTSCEPGRRVPGGWDASEVVGRSFTMFYPLEQRRDGLPWRLLDRALRRGTARHSGWRERRDGSRWWADVVLTPRELAGGDVEIVEVTVDRTAARRAEEEQQAFYASLAHDLLTPVTALRGYAGLLREATPEELEVFVGRIEDNAARLGAMAALLVEHARPGLCEVPRRPEPLDAGELVETVRGRLGASYDVSRVVLRQTTLRLSADRLAMERVLTNVIGNALQYAADGDVTVTLTPRGEDVQLSVSDRGRGIHPDDVPLIFDAFQRGRFSGPDGGTGLGLASARRLVEQQGGSISLSSDVGRGTAVTITLPAAPSGPLVSVPALRDRRVRTCTD